MSEEIVVGTTSGILEGEIQRGLLESRGISVRLSYEPAAAIYGLGVGPLAQVDLLVPADQADQARQILEDYHDGSLVNDQDLASQDDED